MMNVFLYTLIVIVLILIPPIVSGFQSCFSWGIGIRRIDFAKHYFLLGVNSDAFQETNKVYTEEVSLGLFFVEVVFIFHKIDYFATDNQEDVKKKQLY